MKQMKITILTSAYNRAKTLGRLYESILRQKFEDFEWIVVDDGSEDNTNELVNGWISDNKINIRYFKIPNGGKARACNFVAKEAKGELLFVVDSDDYLADNALKRLWFRYLPVQYNPKFAGVCGLRPFKNGEMFDAISWDTLDCTQVKAHFIHHLWGEKAEAYKTKLFLKYPFPVFEGEKYSLQTNELWYKYQIRYFAEALIYGEYLPDGITKNRLSLREKNPMFYMWYYAKFSNLRGVPWRTRIRFSMEYWLYYNIHKEKIKGKKLKIKPPFWSYLIYFYILLSGKKLKY
jgi:glycosyltransferase involved in cell wall biosynthesis